MDHFVYILAGLINELSGGENFYIQPVGFPNNANVVFTNPWSLKKIKTDLNGNELLEYIDSLKFRPEETIHYMKKKTAEKLSYFSRIEEKIKCYKKKKRASKYYGIPFTYLDNQLRILTSNKRNAPKVLNWYESSLLFKEIELHANDVKIFYFPLQLEPEMSTLAYSPWIRDQLEIIRLTAMSLKQGDLLILKENPKMKGLRSQVFYDEVAKYDNVRWANFEINSRDLIYIAFKTISVTGTACIEAACLGKLSMIFGYAPFKDLLIQGPMTDKPINTISKELYLDFSEAEVIKKFNEGYFNYECSLFFANFIPLGKNEYWRCSDLVNKDILVTKTFNLLKNNICVE
jgi:hypothetical protein